VLQAVGAYDLKRSIRKNKWEMPAKCWLLLNSRCTAFQPLLFLAIGLPMTLLLSVQKGVCSVFR
jgi:hypothetical protein